VVIIGGLINSINIPLNICVLDLGLYCYFKCHGFFELNFSCTCPKFLRLWWRYIW